MHWETQKLDEQDYVKIRLGEAIIGLQLFEVRFAMAVGVVTFKSGKNFDFSNFFSKDSKLRKQTLGMLRNELVKLIPLEAGLLWRLNKFVELRNRVVHSLFTEFPIQNDEESTANNRRLIERLLIEIEYFMDFALLIFEVLLPKDSQTASGGLRRIEANPFSLEG